MSAFAMGPSILFCPADRPERFAKAAERADAVILDLEDAVLPAERPAAREHIVTSDLDPARTMVRINPVGSDDFAADLEAVRRSPFRTVMVAKAEDAASLGALGADLAIVALCETARGVVQAEAIAEHPAVVALMWGAEDLVASLGGTASRFADGRYRDVARAARSRVLLAAGAAGLAAIDAVHLDIEDVAGLTDEARDAVASGFTATACIHPAQVAVIRDAYRPSEEEITTARGVLAAAERQHGVFRHEGRMVDEPVLRHARQVLARAGV